MKEIIRKTIAYKIRECAREENLTVKTIGYADGEYGPGFDFSFCDLDHRWHWIGEIRLGKPEEFLVRDQTYRERAISLIARLEKSFLVEMTLVNLYD